MDESVNVVEPAAQAPEPVSTDVGQQAESNGAPEQQAAPEQAAPPAERMIPQSQVSKIAAREAREAAEKARSDERTRMEREYAQRSASQPPPGQQQQPSLGGMQQHSEEDIRRMIQQEAWKLSQMEVATQIERDWTSTMNAEKERDPEFADLYEALNIEQHPQILLWVNSMDNKAAVVRDIAKNPSKFAQVLMLTHSGSPELAKRELQKLSASIKANEDAQKQAHADAPLSQIKPSNIGSDNGEMSVSDYRLIFKG